MSALTQKSGAKFTIAGARKLYRGKTPASGSIPSRAIIAQMCSEYSGAAGIMISLLSPSPCWRGLPLLADLDGQKARFSKFQLQLPPASDGSRPQAEC
jgi:hypothetical protein